jgi:hypothetical protein
MIVKHLKDFLNGEDRFDERQVLVRLTKPSMGPVSSDVIQSAWFGFDWDRDLILEPTQPLVVKSEKESAFDIAYDLLFYIATKPLKTETYEVRQAKRILKSIGKTDEDFNKLRHLFHKE